MDDTNMLLVWIAGLAFASTLFTVCSLLILAACRKSSAAMRCKLNMLAVVGLAVLPALSAFSPKLSLGWLTVDFESQFVSQAALSPKPPAALNAVPGVATNQVPLTKSELATLDGLQKSPLREPIISQPPAAQQQERQESSIASAVEQPRLRDSATSWLAWLLAGYAAGVFVLAGRLCVELAWAIRIRQLAEPFPVGTAIARRLRPSGIGELQVLSADVPVPMVVGAFRPAILVPRQAETWSAAQLTSALSHELAHIDRKDLPMQLFCSLVRCFYWPQPLVHILLGRLRADTELACDHLAVSQCSQPAEYARHLLSIATECIHPPRALSAAVPMFRRGETHRGDLETRVAAVLSPTSEDRPKRTWLLAAMLFFCLFFSAVPTPISAVAQTPNSGDASENSAAQNNTANPEPVGDDRVRVSGRVVDSDGTPIPNVQIVTQRYPSEIVHGSSGEDGSFSLELPREQRLGQMAVTWFYARGYAARTARLRAHDGFRDAKDLVDVEIPLPDEEPIEFSVLGPDGNRLPGAVVSPAYVDVPNGRFMANEPTGLVSFPPKQFEHIFGKTTDADGVAMLSETPSVLFPRVAVRTEEYGLQEFSLEPRRDLLPDQITVNEHYTLRLKPASRVSVRVLADEPLELEGIKVRVSSSKEDFGWEEHQGGATATLDSTGRFVIPKLLVEDGFQLLLDFDWPSDFLYQPTIPKKIKLKTGQNLNLEIATRETVLHSGVVMASDTGLPIVGAKIAFRGRDNGSPQIVATTDSNGRYRVQLMPGTVSRHLFDLGTLAVLQTYDYPKLNDIRVPETQDDPREEEIHLQPKKRVDGRLVDENWDPVPNARLGVGERGNSRRLISSGQTDSQGSFSIPLSIRGGSLEKMVHDVSWFEIVKPAEGTKPPVLRKLEVLDRDPTATVLQLRRQTP